MGSQYVAHQWLRFGQGRTIAEIEQSQRMQCRATDLDALVRRYAVGVCIRSRHSRLEVSLTTDIENG